MTRSEWESSRAATKETLQRCEYGFLPPQPLSVTVTPQRVDHKFCAGKATLETLCLTAAVPGGAVTFPFFYCYLNGAKKQRTVLLLNFRSLVPDKYLPAEEVIDSGWAFAAVNYEDISCDSAEKDANAALLGYGGQESPGKIALWAWGGSRMLDYLLTRPESDPQKIGVAGHSRLGKTALLTAAMDERFAFAHSNDSGTCGAGLFAAIDEPAEHIRQIVDRFPFWFCGRFADYVDCEKQMPFDQDLLLSLIAPRPLCVGSAEGDLWANPPGEAAAAEAARRIYALYGAADRVMHYTRSGLHYLSRQDWNTFLPFFAQFF